SSPSVLHELSKDEKSLRKTVDSLEATGGTPMHQALEIGTKLLTDKVADQNMESYIVLFTDGFPDDGVATVRAGKEAKRRGILVLCIGVGAADQRLLDELASTPGQVEFSKSSEELVSAFGNVARLISGRNL